jgi:hypothetical protein
MGQQVFGGFTLGLPDIPLLYKGGTIARAGMAVVADRGPELIHLPAGAQVTPLSGGGGSGGGQITFGSDGSRVGDLILWLVREAIRKRGGDPVAVLSPRAV